MRYFAYLLIYAPMQLLAWVITPILPLFAVDRYGRTDNSTTWSYEPRLPMWLAWFDTPDNSLRGDRRWRLDHGGGYRYASRVAWLYRNSLYGFKWTVLSAPTHKYARFVKGDLSVNHNTGKLGAFSITTIGGGYWQRKRVGRISGNIGYSMNFGWMLDDLGQSRALFVFSPRIVRLK